MTPRPVEGDCKVSTSWMGMVLRECEGLRLSNVEILHLYVIALSHDDLFAVEIDL